MATTWKFYADAGLTVELTEGGASVVDGVAPTDTVIYLGSVALDKTLQAASDPGTDPVQVLPADSAPGTGVEATAIKLALSSGGLDTATGGAALDVGTTLNSGAINAIPVFVRTSQGALAVGTYADLSLTTNAVLEA